jgi:hypothetical protein
MAARSCAARGVNRSFIDRAAKCGFDLVIRCELAALGLSKAFQDCGKMGGINCFRLSLVTCQGKHGMCYFVLAAGGQPAHRFKCFIQELGHSQ